MNTTFKGNSFEEIVFKLFQSELKNGRLFVHSKASKIFKKKKYFSKERDAYIVTDISIECTLQNSFEPSFFLIIECKDYNESIPVNDLEEFYSKVQQITGANVKAVFVTTSSLQRGALNFAKAKKIAVVRVFTDKKIKWILPRSTDKKFEAKFNNPEEISKAILNQNYLGPSESLCIFDGTGYHSDLINLVLRLIEKL